MRFSDTFKEREQDFRSVLKDRSIVGIRLDGKAFHTFTKQFDKPYDHKFMVGMDAAATYVIERVFPNALLAYVQSDEISIIFTDRTSENGQFPLGGRVEKILSIASSAASVGLIKCLPEAQGHPIFDARLFYLEDVEEIHDYITWRRLDARKNAISMAAECVKSHKELIGVSTEDRLKLLEGTPFERLPEGFMNGRFIVKENFQEEVSYVDKRTNKVNSILADRHRWIDVPAYKEEVDKVISKIRLMDA